jgi:hypothetical protein
MEYAKRSIIRNPVAEISLANLVTAERPLTCCLHNIRFAVWSRPNTGTKFRPASEPGRRGGRAYKRASHRRIAGKGLELWSSVDPIRWVIARTSICQHSRISFRNSRLHNACPSVQDSEYTNKIGRGTRNLVHKV